MGRASKRSRVVNRMRGCPKSSFRKAVQIAQKSIAANRPFLLVGTPEQDGGIADEAGLPWLTELPKENTGPRQFAINLGVGSDRDRVTRLIKVSEWEQAMVFGLGAEPVLQMLCDMANAIEEAEASEEQRTMWSYAITR